MAKALSVVALLLAVVALAINFVVPGPAGVAGAPGADGADGADGVDGVDGLDGATGPAGADGLNCWDLNGNGAPDVATEDRNGDMNVDVNDCQGLSQMRWAHIHGDGTIEVQSGGITVIHGGTGFWFVSFPGNDVLNKPVLASLSRMDFNWPPGTIEATPCGGPPQGVGCTQSNNINTVLVNVADNAGTGTDWAFYIVVVG